MNLEKHINQKKQYDLSDISPFMQNQIQKKKKLSTDSISSISCNQNNMLSGLTNIDNINSSQMSHSTTSPSSSAFFARQFQQASIKNNDLPQQSKVNQKSRSTTQQKLQDMAKSQKQQKEEINEISEYQQSLIIFNLLQNITNSNQQQQNIQSHFDNQSNCESPQAKNKMNQQLNNNSNASAQQSQINKENLEAEFLKQLSLNLQQKQANQFLQQYPIQQASNQSQNSNHFKTPSVPNCFKNSKNEQALNFTSTEEDEDDENYNLSQKQLLQIFSQLLPAKNENNTSRKSFQ